MKALGDQINVKCEYCGVLIRIVGQDAEQYNIANIVSQIVRLADPESDFDKQYERAKVFVEQGKYIDASDVLNKVLDKDVTQARAWFYKALLPVLEQTEIRYKDCTVNIAVVSQIHDRKLLNKYLESCGLSFSQRIGFMKFYGSRNFLYEQTYMFLDKAIKYANSEEERDFYEKQKQNAKEIFAKGKRKKWIANFLWAGLLLMTVGVAIYFIAEFLL